MKKVILMGALFLLITGCSKSAPKCSDANTVKSVTELAIQELRKIIPAEDLTVNIEAIRTTGSDDKTGAQFCEGDAVLNSVKSPTVKGSKFPIKFKSELTDKKEHYVSFGFR